MMIGAEGLAIRPARLEDAPQLNAWWNDGAVMAHAGFPRGLGQSLPETEAHIRRMLDAPNRGLWMLLCGGKTIGESSYRVLSGNAVECGWKICDTSYQNRGIGTAAILLTLQHYFTDPGFRALHPVTATVWDTNLNNLRAQKVYEQKIGAKRLGVRENSWKDQLGTWQSAVDYRLEREDFLQRFASES